jgi:xanthine dehydrogenase accessory factor
VSAGDQVIVAAARLVEEGTPFALATVVDVRRPASARRGDRGVVTADGALLGWVGGACSEPIVIREALRALADGEARLVRICPEDAGPAPEGDVVIAHSTCASEGTVEVLIEPRLPSPLLSVVGESPAARTLARLAEAIGWRVTGELTDRADAVVVATMGRGDEDALAAAVALRAGYIGLVASSRRAGVVQEALRARGVPEAEIARVRSPAGLDLGPSTQEEIAVAILAELVAWRHTRPLPAAVPDVAPAEAVDPVCGMTVAAVESNRHFDHDGVTYWFCGPGCADAFIADPGAYAGSP